MPANSKKSGKRKKPAGRQAPAPSPASKKSAASPESLFTQGLTLAQQGFLFDAVAAFRDIVQRDPKGDLADDALFNSGVCFLKMRLYHDAVMIFTQVIQGYPNASINSVTGQKEFGKTAAKAHLGRLNAFLAMGDTASAQDELKSLKEFTDSYVLDAKGTRKSFHALGLEALKS